MPTTSPLPLLALCRELPSIGGDSLPEWLLLAPIGDTQGRDGRSFTNPDPSAIAAAVDPTIQIPLDWEHATHLRAPEGLPAPAAGWIAELEARADGVWGRVDWTPEGADAVRHRSYRYYSPAYLMDGPRIARIVSVGLTNTPNLDLPALNRRAPTHSPEPAMDERIRQALNLAEGATPEQAVASIEALKTSLNRAQTPDLNQFVPRADLDLALNRATQAETTLRETQQAELNRQVEALIQQGLTTARITPATVEYHRAQATSEGGLERLRQYLAAAPAVISDSGPRGQPSEEPQLNSDERRIMAAFGHTPETLKKYAGGAQ